MVKKNEMDVPKVEKAVVVGKLVKGIETGGPQARKIMKKIMKKVDETCDRKVGEMVQNIQMNDPKVGKVWKLVTFGQEKYKKPEEDAMLAGAGVEDEFIKCFDDIAAKELPWQAAKEAREKELKYLRGLGVYEKVDERTAATKYKVTPVDTKWVDTDRAFEVRACANPFTNWWQRVSKAEIGQTCMRELPR